PVSIAALRGDHGCVRARPDARRRGPRARRRRRRQRERPRRGVRRSRGRPRARRGLPPAHPRGLTPRLRDAGTIRDRSIAGLHRLGTSGDPRYARAVIRLVVVDDHPAIAAAIRAAIRGRDDIALVATASTALEAPEVVATAKPDVVVCDLWLDG